jgi:hypothetical protein
MPSTSPISLTSDLLQRYSGELRIRLDTKIINAAYMRFATREKRLQVLLFPRGVLLVLLCHKRNYLGCSANAFSLNAAAFPER